MKRPLTIISSRHSIAAMAACCFLLPFKQQAIAQLIPPTLADGDAHQTFSAENLSELSLKLHPLTAITPVEGGTTTTASYIRELYQVQWRGGDPIDLYVIRPVGVTRPPVTIYLYGYPVDANRFLNDSFCNLVTRDGEAAIGFVPALTGQRYHSVPISTWFVSELHDSLVKTVHDVQMVLDYAASRSDLDSDHIGVFGQGAGATIAGLAATVEPRIKAVDMLDPWGDWPEWMQKSSLVPEAERASFLKPDSLERLAPLDPVTWLPSLKSLALKLDDAQFETGTPAAAKLRIEAALPSSALLVRYTSSADFNTNAIADGKLLTWIQGQLKSRDTTRREEPLKNSERHTDSLASTDSSDSEVPLR